MNRYNLKRLTIGLGSAILASCASTPETEYELMAKSVQYVGQQMDCAYIVNQSHLKEGITLTRNELIDKAEKVCNNQDLVARISGGAGVLLNGVLIHKAFGGGGGSTSGSRGRTSALDNGDSRVGGDIISSRIGN